jgi:signal transduction histidine kinase
VCRLYRSVVITELTGHSSDKSRRSPQGEYDVLCLIRVSRATQSTSRGYIQRCGRSKAFQPECLLTMKQEFLLDTLQKLEGLTRQLLVVGNSATAQEPVHARIEKPALTSAPNDEINPMVQRLPQPKYNPPVLDAHKVVEMESLISYAKQLVGNIQTCAEHQGLITNNVLDLTRLDAGKVEPIFDVVDVRALGQQIVQMMSSKAQRKQLDLSMSGDGLPPLYLKADATILRQVLLNLVSNAIKVGTASHGGVLYV